MLSESPRSTHRIPFILKHYDASPARHRFGQLQEVLAPYARYAIKDPQDPNRWVVVGFSEFSQRRRNCNVRSGILEVLAQRHFVHYVDAEDVWAGLKIMCRPVIMINTTSSVLYNAVENGTPELAPAGVSDMAKTCPHVWIAELPDSAASCRRKKAQSLEDRAAEENVFDISPPGCAVHSIHGCVARRERVLCGDLHAIHTTCTVNTVQNKMQSELWELILDMDFSLGQPSIEDLEHNRSIVKRTLLTLQWRTGKVSVADLVSEYICELCCVIVRLAKVTLGTVSPSKVMLGKVTLSKVTLDKVILSKVAVVLPALYRLPWTWIVFSTTRHFWGVCSAN